ncbi:apolipoprotein C-I [Conger conger]|nr:apolipoprotein C-I [Conger conger]
MKLPIAIAVLVLVLAANTEAQDAVEPTLEERFTKFGEQMQTLADTIKTKTMATVGDIHDSQFATDTRKWFTEAFGTMKDKLEDVFKQQ